MRLLGGHLPSAPCGLCHCLILSLCPAVCSSHLQCWAVSVHSGEMDPARPAVQGAGKPSLVRSVKQRGAGWEMVQPPVSEEGSHSSPPSGSLLPGKMSERDAGCCQWHARRWAGASDEEGSGPLRSESQPPPPLHFLAVLLPLPGAPGHVAPALGSQFLPAHSWQLGGSCLACFEHSSGAFPPKQELPSPAANSKTLTRHLKESISKIYNLIQTFEHM